MPRRTISDDLKARIPALYHDGFKAKQISDILAVKKSLVYKILTLFSNHGRAGRHTRILKLHFLRGAIDRPGILLEELQEELFTKRGVRVSLSTLARAVKQLHLSRKTPAFKRNEMLRALYMNRIGAEARDANMLLFVDGSAKGESQAGYTILPALTLDGIIAYDITEGPVTADCFVKFLNDYVVCTNLPLDYRIKLILTTKLCRCHSQRHIRVLGASWLWTTAAFITAKRFGSLSKI